jgi:membrane associated rhomboid family serine protease
MVEQASQQQAQEMGGHRATYEGFLKGCIIVTLCALFIMLALVNVGFGSSMPIFKAFAGIIIGVVAVLIDTRAGSGRWILSIGVLALFALVTAMNIV